MISVTADGLRDAHRDCLAVESPLEIRVGFVSTAGYLTRRLSITMRTPGHDCELAAGFLLSERIVVAPKDILSVRESPKPDANVVRVDLAPHVAFNPELQARHFYTTSSCGVCGKASLEALDARGFERIPGDSLTVNSRTIHSLILRKGQEAFTATGGLHAAGLFDAAGSLLSLHEDVGRHNALDKLIGTELLSGRTALHSRIVLVSGRASFELVQKCLAAGVSVLAAVGAPSSLAVDLAREFDLTLLGFVRDARFNIYSGEWRIQDEAQNAGQHSPAQTDTE